MPVKVTERCSRASKFNCTWAKASLRDDLKSVVVKVLDEQTQIQKEEEKIQTMWLKGDVLNIRDAMI